MFRVYVLIVVLWAESSVALSEVHRDSHTDSAPFVLTGKLEGFSDGTRIILNPFLDNMDIDMDNETVLYLKDGKFSFSKTLEKTTKFSLRVRPEDPENFSLYEHTVFWAENKPMTMTGKRGQIFEAKFTGSPIQDEYYTYVKEVAPLVAIVKRATDSLLLYPDLPQRLRTETNSRNQAAIFEKGNKHVEFMYANPQYYFAAPELVFYITFSPDALDINRLQNFYKALTPDRQVTHYGQTIAAFLTKKGAGPDYSSLSIGDYPHNFVLPDLSGTPVKLSAVKGRIILLDFWGYGCAPCRVEHKNYVELYDKFKEAGFEIVSVSADQSERLMTKAVKDDQMTWITLWDETKEVSNYVYNIQALPTNYLIVDGKIVAKNIRGDELFPLIHKFLVP